MAETNQAAIDLIDRWLSEPPVRELKRWEYRFWRGRHGSRERYLFPSVVVAFDENCIQLRGGFITLRWWKWEVAIVFDEHAYGVS